MIHAIILIKHKIVSVFNNIRMSYNDANQGKKKLVTGARRGRAGEKSTRLKLSEFNITLVF